MPEEKKKPTEPEASKPQKEIVVQASPLVIEAPPSPEEMQARAEAQIKIRKAYVRLVAQELRAEDVIVFGEEVYIPSKPCRDILSWARINVHLSPMEEHRYNSPEGDFIIFEIAAKLTDQTGREVDVIANRSTRDDFFGIAGKDRLCPSCDQPIEYKKLRDTDKWDSLVCKTNTCGLFGKKVKPVEKVHYLPLYDVDIGHVRKAAVTNLWNKAIKAIGLAPTLQDLADAGMPIDKIKRIGFRSSKEDAPKSNGQSPKQQTQAPTSTSASAPSSRPAKQPASAATTQPGQAPVQQKFYGNMTSLDKRTAKNKAEYRIIGCRRDGKADGKFFMFDNMEVAIDGRQKRRIFGLLDEAPKNAHIQFIAELRTSQQDQKQRWNVIRFLRINNLEWDEQGYPVIRRDPLPAEHEPGAYEAGDEDVPF